MEAARKVLAETYADRGAALSELAGVVRERIAGRPRFETTDTDALPDDLQRLVFGLRGHLFQERIKLVAGDLSIASAPHRGTTIHARAPLTSISHAAHE